MRQAVSVSPSGVRISKDAFSTRFNIVLESPLPYPAGVSIQARTARK
jgi:hypothetical protein